MKRKKILSGVMAVTLLITSLGMYQGGKNKMASAATNKTAPQLLLQYDEPASDWESEALAIGNGNIGAMVFGGVASERLQINENSVWSGGPGDRKSVV